MAKFEERLCLQWNEFKENISSTFGDLREDKDFTDVTLVCEDGQQVEAHKVILAASSPFFMDILKRNKHPHPLIYMRGLKSENLLAIVDFIYFGEANVFQKNLDSFLALADELHLRGLTDTDSESPNTDNEPKTEAAQRQFNPPLKKEQKVKERKISSDFDHQTSENPDEAFAATNNLIQTDLENLDEQIKSMMTKTRSNNGKAIAICNMCGKQTALGNMPSHIEANHITGVSHACDICGKTSR